MKQLGILMFLIWGITSCAISNTKKDSGTKENVATTDSQSTVTQLGNQNTTNNKSARTNRIFTCKNGDDVRMITHMTTSLQPVPTDKRKCQIVYRKFNDSDVVAYAYHQDSYCVEVFEKIKHNLESGGFLCEFKNG